MAEHLRSEVIMAKKKETPLIVVKKEEPKEEPKLVLAKVTIELSGDDLITFSQILKIANSGFPSTRVQILIRKLKSLL